MNQLITGSPDKFFLSGLEHFCKHVDGKTKKVDYFLLQNMAKLLNVSFEELTAYYPPSDLTAKQTLIEDSLKRETKIIIPKVEFGYDGNVRNLNQYLIDYIDIEIGKSRGASF